MKGHSLPYHADDKMVSCRLHQVQSTHPTSSPTHLDKGEQTRLVRNRHKNLALGGRGGSHGGCSPTSGCQKLHRGGTPGAAPGSERPKTSTRVDKEFASPVQTRNDCQYSSCPANTAPGTRLGARGRGQQLQPRAGAVRRNAHPRRCRARGASSGEHSSNLELESAMQSVLLSQGVGTDLPSARCPLRACVHILLRLLGPSFGNAQLEGRWISDLGLLEQSPPWHLAERSALSQATRREIFD